MATLTGQAASNTNAAEAAITMAGNADLGVFSSIDRTSDILSAATVTLHVAVPAAGISVAALNKTLSPDIITSRFDSDIETGCALYAVDSVLPVTNLSSYGCIELAPEGRFIGIVSARQPLPRTVVDAGGNILFRVNVTVSGICRGRLCVDTSFLPGWVIDVSEAIVPCLCVDTKATAQSCVATGYQTNRQAVIRQMDNDGFARLCLIP